MEVKAIEVLFKNAKQLVEGVQNAGSHEEVDTFANMLESTLNGIHELVMHVLTK